MILTLENQKKDTAYFTDVTNIAYQYTKLQKKPDRKIKDYYHLMNWNFVFIAMLYVVYGLIAAAFPGNWIPIVVIALSTAYLGLCIFGKLRMSSYRKSLMAPKQVQELTIDENGIVMNVKNSIQVHITRENLAAVRIHHNVIFFISKTGLFLIGANTKYQDQILEAMRFYFPNAEILMK